MTQTVVAFYVLAWIFTADGKEREIFVANRFDSRLECNSAATQVREKMKGIKTTYSRFVCVPVAAETGQ